MANQCCRNQISLEQALRELFDFRSFSIKIGFETKKEELKEFVALLNCVVRIDDVQNIIQEHQCQQDCFVCIVRNCLGDFRGIEIDEVLDGFKNIRERISKCRGYGGFFDLVLSLFGLKNKLKVKKSYECGYYESISLKVFIFNVSGFLQEVDKYFNFMNLEKSLFFWQLNSTFLKKNRKLNDSFFDELRLMYCQTNEKIHSPECCNLDSQKISTKLPCFGFRLNWGDLKNLEYKIAQICISFSGTLPLTDQNFFLSKFFSKRENVKEDLLCWRTPDGMWNISMNDQEIPNLSWLATIFYLMMHKARPVFLMYQRSELPEMNLTDEEIIKLESLSTSCVKGIYCMCITNTFHRQIPQYNVVECLSCRSQKYEGFQCDNCQFYEQNWNCECGFFNFFMNLSCQRCNFHKWVVPNMHYNCQKCYKVTEGLAFCGYCPVKKCYNCKAHINGGQVLSCGSNIKLIQAYQNHCECTICLNCLMTQRI
jgi:hypothetical protein